MATSRDKCYTGIFKTLTYYNDRNNTSSYSSNVWEAIHKFIEDESTADANKVTTDTFSHFSNTKRDNTNTIFTSEKLDKSDELVDAVKNLTIKDAKYNESNTETASYSQGDITHNPETVTYTSNGNETVTHSSNGNFEQKSLSNRTIPVFPPSMNPGIEQEIAPIILVPQTLLEPLTK